MSALELAVTLAAHGFATFPCNEGKKPTTTHGFLDATADPAGLRRLWRDHPGPLVGMPTGARNGIDVLDVDPRNNGHEWEAANRARLPTTRTRTTRSGGTHYLFRHHDGVRNSESRVAPGVDIRGEGGYIIVWPQTGVGAVPRLPVAHWPAWLLTAVLPAPRPAYVARASLSDSRVHSENVQRARDMIERAVERVRHARDGEKHRTLRVAAWTVGGLLEAADFTMRDAHAQLVDAVMRAGALDQKNAEKTATWGLERGASAPLNLEDRAA